MPSFGFAAHGYDGSVDVAVEANTDPVALGHGLFAIGFDPVTFVGFPVMTARVSYAGPGLRGLFGWIQLITHVFPDGRRGVAEVDVPPGIVSPYYTRGWLPTLFDAPANPDHPDMRWLAESFLISGLTRGNTVRAVTGFSWGYDLAGGRATILDPAPVGGDRWDAHVPVLRAGYPQWKFENGFGPGPR